MSVEFPAQPCSVIIGGLLSLTTCFIIQRPVFGTLCCKAQSAPAQPTSGQSAPASKASCSVAPKVAAVLKAFLQSYAVNSLLVLTGAKSFKSASVVGSLVLFAKSGQQLLESVFVAKLPWHVVLCQTLRSALDTVGLALALTAIKHGR